jgi:alanine racemase
MMVLVKALAYGTGRHEIASVLQHQRVDYLGVAITDEGVWLRQAGITIPIMVMNPEPESFDILIQYHLEPEIYSFRILELFSKAVGRNQEVNYPVHIKIDTGMHRLGFPVGEVHDLCRALSQTGNIRVTSVFSHLAGSDDIQFDEFTLSQIARFERITTQINQNLGYPFMRHILNTSGIERFPDSQFEMVRLGIGLYGISSVSPEQLRNVTTLKSTILQIKQVLPGETVGYSRSGKPIGPSQIAVVPIGYGDGLNRGLGNGRGRFLVQGKSVPTIGNICMDMTMIDVTNINAQEGDEVTIFNEELPITEIASVLNTIPYEVLTSVSDRVKRVYIHK